MTFKNISDATSCNCLSNSKEDTQSLFARKVGKAKSLKDRDFKSNVERGKEFNDKIQSCDEVCGLFGLSIDIWTDESKDEIMQRYKTTNAFSPKLKKHISIIKFVKGAGKVKYTPVKEPIPNKHHYDFFKSDDFDLTTGVTLVELIPLVNPAN